MKDMILQKLDITLQELDAMVLQQAKPYFVLPTNPSFISQVLYSLR